MSDANVQCPKCGGGPDVYKPFRMGDRDAHSCSKCGYKDYESDTSARLATPLSPEQLEAARTAEQSKAQAAAPSGDAGSGARTMLIIGVVCCLLFFPAFGMARFNWDIVTKSTHFIGKILPFCLAAVSAVFALLFALGPLFLLGGIITAIGSLFSKNKKAQ